MDIINVIRSFQSTGIYQKIFFYFKIKIINELTNIFR